MRFVYFWASAPMISSAFEVIIRREKICDDCCTSEHRADAPTSSEALRSFLSSLPANVQKEALIYLSLGIAQSKT